MPVVFVKTFGTDNKFYVNQSPIIYIAVGCTLYMIIQFYI